MIVFDFCETIVSLQTADEFVFYIHKDLKLPLFNRLIFKFWTFLKGYKIFAVLGRVIPNWTGEKKVLLYSLRGLNRKELELIAEKYSTWLKDKINPNIWTEFEMSLEKQEKVIICSGGYEIYLSKFFKDFNVQIMATNWVFSGDIFSGKIEGLDCLGEEKVRRIIQFLEKHNVQNRISAVYSDSITDMPLFKLADRKIVAYCEKVPKWASDYEFETIKWK